MDLKWYFIFFLLFIKISFIIFILKGGSYYILISQIPSLLGLKIPHIHKTPFLLIEVNIFLNH